MTVYRCWPTKWIAAAIEVGLAEDYGDDGIWFYGGVEMRDKLELFGERITADQVAAALSSA